MSNLVAMSSPNGLWSIPLLTKRNQWFLRETIDSRSGAGNVKDKPGKSYHARSKGVSETTRIM